MWPYFSSACAKILSLTEMIEEERKQLPQHKQQIEEMTHLRQEEMAAELKGEYELTQVVTY